MLDSKKSLKKLNFIYCMVVILCVVLYTFQVQWDSTTLVNNLPLMNNSVVTPILNAISNFVGNSEITTMLFAILTYILLYYIFIVLPVALYHFVRGCFGRE